MSLELSELLTSRTFLKFSLSLPLSLHVSFRRSCGSWGSSPLTLRRSKRSSTASRRSTSLTTPLTWCSTSWRSDTICLSERMHVLSTEWAPLTCKMMTRESLPGSHAPLDKIITPSNPPHLSNSDNSDIAFLVNKYGFLLFEPHLTGRVKALSHLRSCLVRLCWAARIPLTSRLTDCICSTEEGCEISLDLSWYCYTIWNETLSQGESNYLSSFGPRICNISFPLQSLFAVY